MDIRFATLVFSLLATTLAGQDEAAAPAPTDREGTGRHDAWSAILREHVRDERVDYLAIRDERRAELEAYLESLAATDLEKLSRAELEALYVNLYNATMVAEVCDRFVDGWTVEQKKFGIFDEKLVRLGEQRITLNELEKQRAIPKFRDARLHAAFVCAARSCPPLLGTAYVGESIDAQLDARMRAFVNDRSRNRLARDPMQLSKLFEWYRQDFGGSEDAVRRYLAKWTDAKVAGRDIEYLDYSWALNIAQPKGDWVVVRRAGAGLAEGAVVRVESREGDEIQVRRPGGGGTANLPSAHAASWRAPR